MAAGDLAIAPFAALFRPFAMKRIAHDGRRRAGRKNIGLGDPLMTVAAETNGIEPAAERMRSRKPIDPGDVLRVADAGPFGGKRRQPEAIGRHGSKRIPPPLDLGRRQPWNLRSEIVAIVRDGGVQIDEP